MVKNSYIPDRGDIVWLDFNPTKGHEERGSRSALVISRQKYNSRSGLMIACPITSSKKGYPFEVIVQKDDIDGVVLVDQVKSIDWRARKVRHITRVENTVMDEVGGKLEVLIG